MNFLRFSIYAARALMVIFLVFTALGIVAVGCALFTLNLLLAIIGICMITVGALLSAFFWIFLAAITLIERSENP